MAEGPASKRGETAADAALLGRVIAGKYRVDKFLGGGAMGAVYRAHHAALDRNVALKVMHAGMHTDENFIGRFHREAKAASRLDHPNSMRVIDFGEEPDGLLYIAMEYLEGRDLYRVIHDDWPISNADIADMMMQALAAIAVAHEMNVIHRDLKPENLMILRAKDDELRESYQVKVCDFGIAKIQDSEEDEAAARAAGGPAERKLTTQGLVVGTPEYMSPEQARGEKLDARSDIYSMGIILYQLLTGRTPFMADTALAVVLKHITEPPAPPSTHWAGVHKGLEAVTMKALAKDRNDRWQSARAMRNAIREALDGRPAPASDPAPDTALEQVIPLASSAPNLATAPIVIQGGIATPAGPEHKSGAVSAVASAPTVAEGIPTSTDGGLGSGVSPAAGGPKGTRRVGLVIGMAAVFGLLGAAAVVGPRLLRPPPSHPQEARDDVRENAPPKTPVTTSSAPITSEPVPSGHRDNPGPHDPKNAPRRDSKNPRVDRSAKTSTAAVPEAVEAEISAPALAPTPSPPAVEVAPPSPPTPAAPDVAAPVTPAAPFSAAQCTATAGSPHSNGAVNANNLRGFDASMFSACAKQLREKPADGAARIVLQFSDDGRQKSASCATCNPAIKACVEQRAKPMKLVIQGDVTGDPAFEIPLTVSCP